MILGVLEAAEAAAVNVRPVKSGESLHERPAESDVQDLHPAADAKDRRVAREGRMQHRDLEPIPLGIRRFGGGVDVAGWRAARPLSSTPSSSSTIRSGARS